MKDYLNKFMKRNMNPADEELFKLRRVFEQTCELVVENLGEKPFHVRNGLNAAVYDAVMVVYSNQLSAISLNAKERFQCLLNDEEFESCTRSHTTDNTVLARRFSKASDQLFG